MKVRLIVALLATIVAGLGASGAHAQEAGAGTTRGPGGIRDLSPQPRPQNLSVMLHVPYWYGIGIGVIGRYEIPVVPNGFIPQINDQFSIEPSLGLGWRRSGWAYRTVRNDDGMIVGIDRDGRRRALDITPAVYANWSFHVTSKFRPYVAIGLGYTIAVDLSDDDDWSPHHFFFDSAVGMFYRFARPVAFRGEVGSGGLKAGFTFYF